MAPDLAGLLASCLIVVVAYSPILFFGHTLGTAGTGKAAGTNGSAPFPGQPYPTNDFRLDSGASAWALEPWGEVTSRAYANGELPLWNPYQAAGAPHAANMQSAVFDPLLLAVNLNPTPLMWDLAIVGAFMLGAAAAYLFARTLGLRVVPAVVTSSTFSLSGAFFMINNNAFSRSYAFLPLLFLLVELALPSRSLLPLFGLSVAVAANIYVGMPEASFFVIGTAFVYAAVRLVQERSAGPMHLAVLRLGGAAAVGFLLAAPLLLPFLEYESLSHNVHKPDLNRGTEADPAWGLLHWIVPWFPGAPEPPAGPRGWFGAAVAITALAALSGRKETRRLHAWLFFAMGGLVLVKIYDLRLLEWLGHVPIAELVVFPTFAPPVAAFAFAMLAGIGVQVLWARDLQPRLFLALLGTALVTLIVVLSADDRLRTIVENRETVWMRGAFFTVLTVAAIILASRVGRLWSASFLAGVIVAELLWLAPFSHYALRADPYLTPGWMSFTRTAQGDEPYSRVFAIDGKLHPNTAGAHGLQDIRALDALYVSRYWRYVQTFIQPEADDRFTGLESPPRLQSNPMFDALGVRAVISRRKLANVPDLRYVGRERDTRVYKKLDPYPRAWVVRNVHVVDGEDDAFAFLESRARRGDQGFIVNAFDPRHEAVVEGKTTDETLRSLRTMPAECTAPGRDRATIERYRATSVVLRVEAACAGLLVLPDTYYPGWNAIVDGRRETIYPTNGAFRGVAVPKGTSRVEFRYEPVSFSIGIILALAGLVAFAIIWIASAWRRRRSLEPKQGLMT